MPCTGLQPGFSHRTHNPAIPMCEIKSNGLLRKSREDVSVNEEGAAKWKGGRNYVGHAGALCGSKNVWRKEAQ